MEHDYLSLIKAWHIVMLMWLTKHSPCSYSSYVFFLFMTFKYFIHPLLMSSWNTLIRTIALTINFLFLSIALMSHGNICVQDKSSNDFFFKHNLILITYENTNIKWSKQNYGADLYLKLALNKLKVRRGFTFIYILL
jgi:hypothetical protein